MNLKEIILERVLNDNIGDTLNEIKDLKEQLLTQIEQLPKFVLRDIYIKSEEITNDGIVESENKYTKENRLIGITEKHQSPIITTISKNYQ